MNTAKRIKSGAKIKQSFTAPKLKQGGHRGCSFQPLPCPTDEARQDTGGNKYSAEFAAITALILNQFGAQTFSINDAYSLSRGLDIPPGVVKTMFADWTRKMLASGRIIRIPSCMDDDLYSVV
jgi:hypothetical protein